MNILEYKGYHGTVEPDMERGVMRGKLLFIADLVTYEAETLPQLGKEFEAAVDDYLETCEELAREPQKPASGTFNVRTPPELHRAAQVRAVCDGVSMNEVVTRALHCYLHQHREVRERLVEKHTKTTYMAVGSTGTRSMLLPLGTTESKEVHDAVVIA